MPSRASRIRPSPSALPRRADGATFPLAHRLERLAWSVVWGLFGIWTPAPLRAWRRFLVRLFGGRIAATANIYGGVRIWMPRNLTLDDHACLGPGVDCYCMDQITLGAHALVSQNAFLCGGTHDVDDPDFPLRVGPIVVGPHAWVAARAMVGPGVSLGEGAVLGGGAVTFRDLEPWTVYTGNPATALRRRRGGPGEAGAAGDDG